MDQCAAVEAEVEAAVGALQEGEAASVIGGEEVQGELQEEAVSVLAEVEVEVAIILTLQDLEAPVAFADVGHNSASLALRCLYRGEYPNMIQCIQVKLCAARIAKLCARSSTNC